MGFRASPQLFLGLGAFSRASGLFWAFCGFLSSFQPFSPQSLQKAQNKPRRGQAQKIGKRPTRSPTEAGKSSRRLEKAQKRPEDQKCCPKNRKTSTNKNCLSKKANAPKGSKSIFFCCAKRLTKTRKPICFFSAPKG